MENNTIIYYDENGIELARFIFDTNYTDFEIADKKLFKPMSELFPVDNTQASDSVYIDTKHWD